MESFFEYRRIGSDFRAELLNLLERQESVVLLGPRNSGKLFVLRETEKSLPPETIHVRVEFPNKPPIVDADGLRNILRTRIQKSVPNNSPMISDERPLLGALESLCSATRRHVVFMASNIDSMAHHLAQQFLREIRVLCQRTEGRLTAMLTGEENLRDLVWGEDSEFNTAHQFVVQGYDQNEFMNYMRRRHEVAELHLGDELGCLTGLFEVTGGSTYLARATLWAWMESQARVSPPSTKVLVESEDFLAFIKRPLISQFESMSVLEHSEVVISHDPQAWRDLDSLIHRIAVTVDSPNSEPTVLELAGIAVRDGHRLRFASPMTEQLARSRYGETQFGDLYAIHGDWEMAISFYQRLPEQHRIRPNGSDDRIQMSHVLKALGGKLNSLATGRGQRNSLPTDQERLEQVKRLFVEGCLLLLGASEVTFWTDQRDTFPSEACMTEQRWHVEGPQRFSDKVTRYGQQFLNTLVSSKLGWHEQRKIAPKLAEQGAIALLPTIRSGHQSAVIVSNIQHAVSFSRDRYELLKELIEQFTNAYDHLIANMVVSDRLAVRKEQLSVATGIIAALGETVRNPREALTVAAEKLLKLGFKRIMFALVDSTGRRVRGVSQAIGEPCSADIANETNYELGQRPYQDIQPWVVEEKRHVVVDDWRTWNERQHDFPPVNRGLCENAAMKSFAVVPMLIRKSFSDGEFGEEVFGTIHFELNSGLVPTQDDIDDMLEFGRQMAAAVHQSERVNVLLETLNSDPDVVVIFDHDRYVRFSNDSAAKRFGISSGWHASHSKIRLQDPGHLGLDDLIQGVISNGKTVVRHNAKEARSESLFGLPLPDWRGCSTNEGTRLALGAALMIRDLTPLHRVFAALLKIARQASDRENTAEVLLSGVKDLGYSNARLYRIDINDPNLMVSLKCSGLSEEFKGPFDHQGFKSNRGSSGHQSAWWCIDNAQPRVFQWNPKCNDGESSDTTNGLRVYVVKSPAFRGMWKREGDTWLDLPLIAYGKVIGKLSIDCGVDYQCALQPEDFELLKLFSALLGALLDALDKKERWMHDAAEKAIATCAHTIRTKLAGLSGFSRRYADAAPGNETIIEWNRIHQAAIDGSMNAVARVVQIFGNEIKLTRHLVKLRPLLNDVLKTHTASIAQEMRNSTIEGCPDDLMAFVDPDCLRIALEELLMNSRQMICQMKDLHVQIDVSAELRGNLEWLTITVRDNGPGIPDDEKQRVFETFYSHRPQGQPGSGLGLNYVRRIVEAHGGKIHARTEPNWGAVFDINLPNGELV